MITTMNNVDVESVRSGHSEKSNQSRRSHGSAGKHRRSRHRQTPNRGRLTGEEMNAINSGDGGSHAGDETIEVQIIPQDDNWGENTTCITGNTSERSVSMEDMSTLQKEFDESLSFKCTQYLGTAVAVILALFAFLTPVAFVVLPEFIAVPGLTEISCDAACEGLLMSLSFKLAILLIGSWALFYRRPKASMPRVFVLRGIVLVMTFIFTFCYWLFYGVRILAGEDKQSNSVDNLIPADFDYDRGLDFAAMQRNADMYYKIVQYAVSFIDALLFIHYLAVILLEIRQMQSQFTINVVRSPDGEHRAYNLGQLSIQRAAVWVLEQYYKDFPVYNPYLEKIPSRTHKNNSASNSFKFYDIDSVGGTNSLQGRSRAVMAAAARRRDSGHNERFYEELEYERRLRRRKARLLSAAEEAFTHIKRLQNEPGPAIPMDPAEAAQAVFPTLARALQKYLRVTRQQPYYTLESILEHLAVCISHDMSPKSFLERYLQPVPGIFNNRDYNPIQTWALVSDLAPSRAIEDAMVFQLKNGEVSLLINVRRIPHFNVTEEVIDPKNNRFVLRLNSETSV